MKKKIKDLTREEMDNICEVRDVNHCGRGCPLYNKRSRACARHYPDTLESKFTEKELNKKVKVLNKEDFK